MAGLAAARVALAGPIPVPNGSFESPAAIFVDTNIDAWERTARPPDYDESGGFLWSQLTGIFRNTAPGSADHIVNADGNQAVWLFAVPGVGMFQDSESRDWNDEVATHAFDVRFTVGRSYTLTVGVIGAGGGMAEGTSLEIGLYHLDAAGTRIPVASTRVVNGAGTTDRTRLIDYRVEVPPVQPSDPWAGRPLGIRFLSTVEAARAGGYWDLDHVRLEEVRGPAFAGASVVDGQVRFTVEGEPGRVVDLLESRDPGRPVVDWTVMSSVTNLTGTATFLVEPGEVPGSYFRVRQRP